MHILVLGAGVVGITTAWHLRQAGHTVSVIDRQAASALETSFANGGQISVSHAGPWATPQAPLIGLRGWVDSRAPVRFSPTANHRQWRWMAAFLYECLPGRVRRNTDALARLAVSSQAELRQLQRTLQLSYDQSDSGILHVFSDRRELERARARAAARETAEALGVRLMLPLGACILPAFLLIGVVPMLIGLLSSTTAAP